jgi:hypothetical protein
MRTSLYQNKNGATSHNTEYTLRAYALALRDISFGNFFYPQTVIRNSEPSYRKNYLKVGGICYPKGGE